MKEWNNERHKFKQDLPASTKTYGAPSRITRCRNILLRPCDKLRASEDGMGWWNSGIMKERNAGIMELWNNGFVKGVKIVEIVQVVSTDPTAKVLYDGWVTQIFRIGFIKSQSPYFIHRFRRFAGLLSVEGLRSEVGSRSTYRDSSFWSCSSRRITALRKPIKSSRSLFKIPTTISASMVS